MLSKLICESTTTVVIHLIKLFSVGVESLKQTGYRIHVL